MATNLFKTTMLISLLSMTAVCGWAQQKLTSTTKTTMDKQVEKVCSDGCSTDTKKVSKSQCTTCLSMTDQFYQIF